MTPSPQPPPALTALRKLHLAVGFAKARTFFLWLVFAGGMLGFCLARLMYLDFAGVFCSSAQQQHGANHAAPGECYWYTAVDVYRVGIRMHLGAVVPAGALACVQFTPVVRRRMARVHRVNGYATLLLSLVGVAGAVMVAPVAFGGHPSTRGLVGVLGVLFVGALALAYYYIRKKRIDQHRAWMLRAWFYAGSIVTARFIMMAAAAIVSSGNGQGGFYEAKLCRQLASYLNSTRLLQEYPDCASLDAWVLVKADLHIQGPEHISAALDVTFGMSVWMAAAIHAIGVEFYLQLTPGETRRLREVSRQRQVEVGLEAASKAIVSDHGRDGV
ncbi:hypothetical protein CCM_07391 [Cordyceps militaris CM01]|uniref:Microtubule associated protein n=1 Tax=Cordyceps militaris (strain CM01) TaxID=983644 RepID=G3JPN8_CORMM|nr:uncharacterized protein CCM_07391 [Cordyceps militaris CM01]EGX89139.1 hypothetical protein CCM_07391 [Cordyceps militaris CM01]